MKNPVFPSLAPSKRRRRVGVAALGLLALLGAPLAARAQLTWGVNGAGGSGNWDTTTTDWYNGTGNVVWDSSSAVFGGTAGTVSAVPFLSVQGMTFNVAGYTISNGFFEATNNLTVTTNADATINSVADSNATGGTFVKNGPGTLTYAGTNFFGNVQLNAGNYVATTTAGSFFSAFNLANAAGVALTFGSVGSGDLDGLNGGGTTGGVVQPGAQGGTVNVTNFGGGSFAGVLQNSAGTTLGYTQFGGPTAQTLTGVNTYSGTTTLTAGSLTFAGTGTALNTSLVSVGSGTALTLDNSGTAVGNRLPDSAPVLLSGGKLGLVGNAATAVTETLGAVNFYGANTLNATLSGSAAARLSFAGITRNGGATLNVTGTGGVTWGGLANGSNGIVAPYVTAGNEWAVVGSDGTVQPLANYATNPATAGSTDHVKLTAASTALTAAASTFNTLNLQNAAASAQTVDLGAGHTLTLAGGGLLTSGSGPATLANGTLAAGGELVVTNHNALTVGSAIAETASGTALTKSGEGTLTLTGSNTYTGATHLVQGVLAVSSDANLGGGTALSFDGGTLQANASFTTAKNLTRTSAQVATLNTNGYNVTVTGTNDATQQTGAGLLTLTTAATGSTYTSPTGTLALPNATSGTSTIGGGTLRAAGTLTQLNLNASGTLDIGGTGAQSLTLNNYNASAGGSSAMLTVRFTLGSTAQDHLSILAGGPSIFSNRAILFTIDGLGMVQTGVAYTVLNLPNGTSNYTASEFGLSPESTAAGYQGTFVVGANGVTLTFSAVPEPSTWVLLGLGGAGLWGMARRRRAARA